jgi:hypothetical protein
MMSTQINFHVQISCGTCAANMTPEQEAAFTNALRHAVFDTLLDTGLPDGVVTIRGPEVVSLF